MPNIQSSLESLQAQHEAVRNRWKRNLESVNTVRTQSNLSPLGAWNETVVSRILENFDQARGIADQKLKMGMGVTEATQASDVSFLRTHGINILTSSIPNLIALDLVSVQPLQARVGEIRFLDVKYGNDKGRIRRGENMFSNERVGGPTGEYNYTADAIDGEALLFDVDKKVATVTYLPVVAGTIQFDADGKTFIDNGKGNIVDQAADTVPVGKVDYATGTITMNAALTATDEVTVDYQYDNLTAPTQVPELEFNIKPIPVMARSRKLKTIISFDAMYDMQTQYGFDSATEAVTLAAQQLQYEIDGEVIQDLYTKANATGTTFSSTVPNAVSMLDHYEGFIKTLNEASNNIFETSRFATGTYMVAGLDAATIMESLSNRGFQASGETLNGPHFIGMMGNFSIYKTPSLSDGKGKTARDGYFMGYKGDSLFHAGYVYAPYMPIMTTDLLAQSDFGIRQGYATSYAKKVVNANLYSAGKITV